MINISTYLPALLSACIAVTVIFSGLNHTLLRYIPDWKVYQIFAAITGFVLVFRTQLSYQRYWVAACKIQGTSVSD